jgi:Uma2 family endonuclease
MSVQTRPLTYDDLCRMPDDGQRYELIGGELYVAPAPMRPHQRFLAHLHAMLWAYVIEHRLGEAYFSPVAVRLSDHDVVEPDLVFLRQDRLHLYNRRGDIQGAPDLVVEVISPSSEKTDPGVKLELYARSGIPEYWLVNPATKQFQGFVLREARYVEEPPEGGRYRSTVIEGFEVELAALVPWMD